jgi:hypothetical protein
MLPPVKKRMARIAVSVQIGFTKAKPRRFLAAIHLGNFGPPAKAAVPKIDPEAATKEGVQ